VQSLSEMLHSGVKVPTRLSECGWVPKTQQRASTAAIACPHCTDRPIFPGCGAQCSTIRRVVKCIWPSAHQRVDSRGLLIRSIFIQELSVLQGHACLEMWQWCTCSSCPGLSTSAITRRAAILSFTDQVIVDLHTVEK
jgi:hypothetical protein